MSIKCKLSFHNWINNCEICSDCGKERKNRHDWSIDCEKCAKCGLEKINQHDWSNNCEKCSLCKKERKNQHDWSKECEKCAICKKTRKNKHDWTNDSQKCSICNKTRKAKEDKSIDVWQKTGLHIDCIRLADLELLQSKLTMIFHYFSEKYPNAMFEKPDIKVGSDWVIISFPIQHKNDKDILEMVEYFKSLLSTNGLYQ